MRPDLVIPKGKAGPWAPDEIEEALTGAWQILELLHHEMYLSGRVNDYSVDELDWMHDNMGAAIFRIKQMSMLTGDVSPFGGRKQ